MQKLGKIRYTPERKPFEGMRRDAVRICRNRDIPFYIKNDLAVFNNGVYLSGDELNEDKLNL